MPYSLQVLATADGSHTLALPDKQVTYHSRHGAVQESSYVFIQTGLLPALASFRHTTLQIFEMGFGTGLNALLTATKAAEQQQEIRYHSIDLYPLPEEKRQMLNYGDFVQQPALWAAIGACAWGQWCKPLPGFSLKKEKADLLSCNLEAGYHLVYFDAFAPDVNPELWTEAVFEKLFTHTLPGGLLVTYCSKSIVRKALEKAGWQVEKLPGPPGKREIVRALKRA